MNTASKGQSDAARLNALVDLAKTGDQGAIAELQRVLDENPQVWRAIGDLGAHVEASYIGLVAGQNVLVRDSIRRQAEELRQSLLAEGSSAAEKLLVNETIVTWLALRHAELRAAQDFADSQVYIAAFYQRRLTTARSQFQKTLRCLETFRGLKTRGRSARKTPSQVNATVPAPEPSPVSPETQQQTAAPAASVPGSGGNPAAEEFGWKFSIPLDDVQFDQAEPPASGTAT